jgi:hypothetical protein
MIHLISMLEIRIYLPDEYVCYEGQISEEMYFIESGVLEVLDGSRGVKIRLSEGDFFGEQVKKLFNFPHKKINFDFILMILIILGYYYQKYEEDFIHKIYCVFGTLNFIKKQFGTISRRGYELRGEIVPLSQEKDHQQFQIKKKYF